jgi:hypothetical protein
MYDWMEGRWRGADAGAGPVVAVGAAVVELETAATECECE